jgi:hypothetical protein
VISAVVALHAPARAIQATAAVWGSEIVGCSFLVDCFVFFVKQGEQSSPPFDGSSMVIMLFFVGR